MADELHWQNVNNLKNCEKQNRKPKTLNSKKGGKTKNKTDKKL